jgi:hypothetical protein
VKAAQRPEAPAPEHYPIAEPAPGDLPDEPTDSASAPANRRGPPWYVRHSRWVGVGAVLAAVAVLASAAALSWREIGPSPLDAIKVGPLKASEIAEPVAAPAPAVQPAEPAASARRASPPAPRSPTPGRVAGIDAVTAPGSVVPGVTHTKPLKPEVRRAPPSLQATEERASRCDERVFALGLCTPQRTEKKD